MANQPDLATLLSNYLAQQADAHGQGLGANEAGGEVVPHEAGPVQPVDPRLAWSEAVACATQFAAEDSGKTPSCWPVLVAALEPTVALAFCTGNFPQLVRDVHPLLQTRELSRFCPAPRAPLAVTGASEWALETTSKKQFPQALHALALLRLTRQFDQADNLVRLLEQAVPAKWRSAWANEKAALAWHRGRCSEARDLWKAQPESVPVLFNRGMAALFLGDAAEARTNLGRAVSQISEDSSWHHLGRLYLALAEAG